LDYSDHANPQIVRITHCSPLRLEKATESYSRRERNPLESQKVETALEPGTRRIIVIPGDGGSVQQLTKSGVDPWNFAVLADSRGMGAPDAGARPGAFAVPAARQEYVYYPSINFRVVELGGPSFPQTK
ncbi:MAG TPA: hypothetical protein VKG24_01635, partial [Pseudolabrys sp.]|nr:hypothetical protein [Pseudolabrys sp.]